jgi:quinol monooxygenase YgiN
MATLLCHIEINPGKEPEFEAVMKEMYRRTHSEEPDCVRYEYYRGARPNTYYSLLSFTDRKAFLEHQISDYHEGFDFASMIKSLEMEWVDPVCVAADPDRSGGVARVGRRRDKERRANLPHRCAVMVAAVPIAFGRVDNHGSK